MSPYIAGDVTDEHVSWLNDREHMKYSEQRHVTHTLYSQHYYVNHFPGGSHLWLIHRPTVGDVGTIAVYRDRNNGIADMGILIAKDHHGKGYGYDAWATVMDFLWEDGVRKVEGGCMAANLPMRALFLKVGMQFEGLKFRHFVFNGEPTDCLYYGRLK